MLLSLTTVEVKCIAWTGVMQKTWMVMCQTIGLIRRSFSIYWGRCMYDFGGGQNLRMVGSGWAECTRIVLLFCRFSRQWRRCRRERRSCWRRQVRFQRLHCDWRFMILYASVEVLAGAREGRTNLFLDSWMRPSRSSANPGLSSAVFRWSFVLNPLKTCMWRISTSFVACFDAAIAWGLPYNEAMDPWAILASGLHPQLDKGKFSWSFLAYSLLLLRCFFLFCILGSRCFSDACFSVFCRFMLSSSLQKLKGFFCTHKCFPCMDFSFYTSLPSTWQQFSIFVLCFAVFINT